MDLEKGGQGGTRTPNGQGRLVYNQPASAICIPTHLAVPTGVEPANIDLKDRRLYRFAYGTRKFLRRGRRRNAQTRIRSRSVSGGNTRTKGFGDPCAAVTPSVLVGRSGGSCTRNNQGMNLGLCWLSYAAKKWTPGRELHPRFPVLQTSAFPLGYLEIWWRRGGLNSSPATVRLLVSEQSTPVASPRTRMTGLEPVASCLGNRRSFQLSYILNLEASTGVAPASPGLRIPATYLIVHEAKRG